MNARGMTLVELLVVLVILAGLTAAVMTGAAATREKGRYEQTARDAEAMAEALTRADGLSLVSDLGLAPDSAEALCLLFGARLPTETVTPDPENPGGTVTSVAVLDVPAWALRSAPLIPAAIAPADLPAEVAAITNRFAAVTLGAGWRGPYCEGRALDADDSDPDNPIPYVVDGFGGPWEFDGETLVSRGRDRMDDALRPDAAAVDWRDRDRSFAVAVPTPTLSLTVKPEGDAVVKRLHVFVHQPALTVGAASASVGLACRYHRFENADSVLLDEGLTLGERVVFVLAETASGAMAAPPRRVLLRPGANAVTLPLHYASAYPLTSP
ncbi:MAG TPA: prepilin-type N-terminal cleavage/methylation domain-containing protein [Candidatus Spyradenecus faecavium]|uniref:Prepilin-type N-terminal cleavage/methylation domain-containing protein n=1 Tax=Candidatus Spyradenecus faecavium TaxID=2840947 RepID=A0A9D1NND8_9BACT|nr:prepilin-type N-terminal cleavage/methylation domain-containing protein [Candidatus Spyradenecus faecavium]